MKTIFSKLNLPSFASNFAKAASDKKASAGRGKVGTSIGVALFFAFVLTLSFAPRVGSVTSANGCDANKGMVFNAFPVTWGNEAGSNCEDFAVVAGNVRGAGVYAPSFQAKPGDEILMRVYVHNSAASNSGLVMHNVQANTSIDYNSGYISTTLSADGVPSREGNVSISLAPGTHLELVSGDVSPYIGDLDPCFEFSQQFYFTLRVVGPAVNPTGSISASLTSGADQNCLYTAHVHWETTDLNSVAIFVTDPDNGNAEKSTDSGSDGDDFPAWLSGGSSYRFVLRAENNFIRYSELVSPQACASIPPAQGSVNSFSATLGAEIPNCLFTGTVSWSTTNLNNVRIFIVDPTSGAETLYAAQESDTNRGTPWLEGNRTYRFVLRADGISDQVRTITTGSPTGPGCVNTPPPVIVCPSGSVSVNPNSILVGQTANLSAPSGWFGGSFTSGNSNIASVSGSTIRGNSIGNVSISGSGFTSANGATNCSLSFTSITVNQVANPPLASCPSGVVAINPSSILVGQFATVSAPSGWSNGSFTSFNPSIASVSGNLVRGNSVGSVSISGSGFTAANGATNCSLSLVGITVNQPTTPICIANTNAALNASSPSKQGSSYTSVVSWSFTGNNQIKITQINPGSTSEIDLIVSGLKNGSQVASNLQPGSTYIFKMYDINPSCGQFLTSTQVTTPANAGQLVCFAISSNINSGTAANFSVNGGNAPYSWSGDGNPVSGNGSFFNPTYTNSTQFPVNHSVSVSSSDGQTTQCSLVVNGTPVTPPQTGIINLAKTVTNITAGDSSYSHSTTAKQGDVVQYQIQVSAGTSVTINNVVVTDTFAPGLNFVAGSLQVNGQTHARGLTSGGLTFASVNQNPILITYQATVSAASGSLVNTAAARADNATNTPSDQAVVSVSFVQPGQPSLAITKQVQNVTQNTGYSSSVNAIKGETVKYQVTVKNIGQAKATHVFFSDSNPVGVQPLSNLNVSKASSGNISSGVSLGDLNPGETVTINYQGTVSINSGSIVNEATASADNAASQKATALVNVAAIPVNNPPANQGNCNNDNNSCNTTTTTTTNNNSNNTNNNTNTGTNNNSANSSNQGNQNNINGNNNAVTSTNNNCVNYSCNTITNTTHTNVVYITTGGTVVPANQFSQLSITKNVRNVNGGTYQNSVSVNHNDTVQFEIVVTNSGNATANNVRVTDSLPNGLSLVQGTLQVNGNTVSDNNLYNGMFLGSLSTGQQSRINFQARVNSNSGNSIQNNAAATSDNAGTVQASAWVFVNNVVYNPGCTYNCGNNNVSLTYNKRAVNETKNADATSVIAGREDFITYTLTVTNNGNAPANSFVITDDLSQVLPYADMVDNGGGNLNGNTINYPGITVPAGGSVSRSFKVRVKFALASNLSYVMTNTYGNTITVRINTPQVLGTFTAPKTGADTSGILFSGMLTASAAVFRKRKDILKLIFT